MDAYGSKLWFLRFQPSHAIHYLTGIALPPHERMWVRLFFAGYKENLIVGSRGTSKTFTHASLAAPVKGVLYRGLGILELSASGFRGGKLLLDDAERLVNGDLKGQRISGPFLRNSIATNNVVKRDADRWQIKWASTSYNVTVPTNNADTMRGIRSNLALVDERNTFDGTVVHKIIRPMQNVGGDFRRTAKGGDSNQIFQFSTIDYTTRDWHPELEAARAMARAEFDAQKARKEGDWGEFDRIMNGTPGIKTASIAYSRVDYTDLLIPTEVEDLEGNVYEVNYPPDKGLSQGDIVRWDENDQRAYIYTYPVDKDGLEEPLRQGTVDEELWMAEQRNVPIAAAGNVFPHEVIRKMAERPVYLTGQIKGFSEADDFFAPIMLTCGDPCVLGVDYGRESDHFALVVIRLGELSSGTFNPYGFTDAEGRQCFGHTSWNHIVWAETWPKWTADQAAERIRALYKRYNVVRTTRARGIALDQKYGGGAVRDELAKPRPPVDDNGLPVIGWEPPIRIYDPDDEDYIHYQAETDYTKFWPGLQLINATNTDNVTWTNAAKALMQQSKLYLGYWMPPSRWAADKGLVNMYGEADLTSQEYQEWKIGFDGMRRLKSQLERIQAKVTEGGVIRYVMPGARDTELGKKDLFSALIYGTHLVREHTVDATRKSQVIPMVEPIIVQVSTAGSRGSSGYRRIARSTRR